MGLSTWTRFVQECKEQDTFANFKEIQDLRQHRQRRATFSKCVKAWQRRDRGSAFRTWVTTTIFLRNLGRCVSRMCHRQLAAAFTKWSGRSFALSRKRHLHEDSVKRLARNLQRWLRWRRQPAGWLSWLRWLVGLLAGLACLLTGLLASWLAEEQKCQQTIIIIDSYYMRL